ncbi:ATP-dependent clp protease adaptor protein clpS domain-containing protein [Ditylenchus destructor]|uniref:E3 ubiquitin-protein ligase n=1 Tax=Ditylenchus destructor TaxID=166010 RepID=A0AAD4R719_9BILA|nr:ATP-dependent clp protease adaptor protein clpS domain-containing protein [Ditylenchus destructor]
MIDQILNATRQEDWRKASTLLYKHWSQTCPNVYAITGEPWDQPQPNDDKIEKHLLYPLAAMYCCEQGASDSHKNDISLKRLGQITGIDASNRRPGQICGRVFKNGEPNYTCKDCATDGTCVLCRDCFLNSAHVNHKYKMHTSLGYGYCDCGDSEAWSRNHICKIHSTSEDQEGGAETTGSALPSDLETRLYNVSSIACRFIVNLLCWSQTESLPSNIIQEIPYIDDDEFQTVLFNDETHTYEAVIRALELAVHCSNNQAMRLATIVDREGRSIVKTGKKEVCDTVKAMIERRTAREPQNRRTQKSGPLEVKVFRSSLVSYQNFALRLMSWMSSQSQEFPPMSTIIGDVLLYECYEEKCPLKFLSFNNESPSDPASLPCQHPSICLKMMEYDRKLWKAARLAFHQLLMCTVLVNLKQKQEFGRIFVRNYVSLFNDFIDDDHEHSVSIVSMTVQVFTVPTVARYLVVEENVLDLIYSALSNFCQKYVTVSHFNDKLLQLDFASDSYPAVLRRACYMLSDASYLLNLVPKPEDWTDPLRVNFLRGGVAFLRFLRDVEGMDEVKRQSVEHQLMESEWETAFNLFIRTQDPLSLMLEWTKSDVKVHLNLFKKCLMEIHRKIEHMPEFSSQRQLVEINGISAHCISFDVSKQPLSIHRPLWRFVAGLFTASKETLSHYVIDDSEHIPASQLNLKGFRSILMEMPLRVIVLQAQCNAQLWRRNGFSLVNQMHNYSSHLCRTEMFDRDVLLLQVVAALMDPNKFIIRVLDKFTLSKWAEIGFEDSSTPLSSASIPGTPSATPEELSKISTMLAEEMLQLLIFILGERYLPGLGECSPMQCLEREILHILCTGPQPFSKIERAVPNDPGTQRLSIDVAVKNVGEFKKPTATTSGMFYLKSSLLSEYNPFFWHYSKTQMSQAEQQQKKERANLRRDLIACPPPMPPNFAPFFKPIVRLAECELFIKLLRVIFERVGKRSRFSNDGCFHRALFLTGMALNEQQRAMDNGEEFGFIHKAETESLLSLMTNLQNKPEGETHADLLACIIQKYQQLNNRLNEKQGKRPEGKAEPAGEEGTPKTRNAEKASIAARKRQLALERMKQLQRSFKNQNIEHIDTDEQTTSKTRTSVDESDNYIGEDEEYEQGTISDNAGFPVCCGPRTTPMVSKTQRKITCILCQEDETLSFNGSPIVCAGFIQTSRIFSMNRFSSHPKSTDMIRNRRLDIFTPIETDEGTIISTCSHTMHYACYKSFVDSLNVRERTRARQQLTRMVNYDDGEFLCPLCKRLSNCALPFLPVIDRRLDLPSDNSIVNPSFGLWLVDPSKALSQLLNRSEAASRGRKRSNSEGPSEKISVLLGHLLPASLSRSTPSNIRNSSDLSALIHDGPISSDFLSRFRATPHKNSMNSKRFYNTLVPEILALNKSERQEFFQHRLNSSVSPSKKKSGGLIMSGKNGEASHFDSSCFVSVPPFLKALTLGNTSTEGINVFGDAFERFNEALSVLESCAFVLRSICAILEAEKKPLFGALNARQRDCINATVRLAAVIPLNCHSVGFRVLVTSLMDPLVNYFGEQLGGTHSTETSASESAARSLFDDPDKVNIMEIDMLTLAVELLACVGSTSLDQAQMCGSHEQSRKSKSQTLVNGSVNELYILRLTLLANLFQTFMSFDENESLTEVQIDASKGDTSRTDVLESRIKELFQTCRSQTSLEDWTKLYQKLCYAIVTFLRPLALYYNVTTLVPPPESLKDPSVAEMSSLCRYMGLPLSLSGILEGTEVETLFQEWTKQIPVTQLTEIPSTIHLPLKMNLLMDLPHDYSELINMASKFRCPSVKADDLTSAVPTLCLNCGELLCSQSYCCQRLLNEQNVGACTYHMAQCNGSSGIFLRIRDCQIVLLTTSKRGCQRPAPYVDEFGETDPGFRRGNPMHLNTELYWKLQRVWMYQEIAEEVVYSYDSNHRNIALEWQHF